MSRIILIVKKYVIFTCLIVLLLAVVGLNLFYRFVIFPINVYDVESINLYINEIFYDDVNLVVSDSETIEYIVKLEDFIRKNDGSANNFLIKARPWTIVITYHMKNQEQVIREYTGRKSQVELQKKIAPLLKN